VRAITIILAGCLFAIAAGCENGSSKAFLKEKISTLSQEKAELKSQIEKSKSEAEQLKKQVQVLSKLPPEVRIENLYDLQKIRITRYTNLYDENKDGKKETLIVYIQPIDEEDDIVKASGAVEVELWNLNKKEGQVLLGRWHVTPEELKKLWFATIVTINYRLTFDVSDKITGDEKSLVVKVTFTDYPSGKVFEEQKIIKPR
jgi:outer membrane murein-binding lipoprotein Lpp